MNAIKTKVCTKCQVEKSVELFSKNKTRKDGLQTQCKECRKAYLQDNDITNADKISERMKAYYQTNREEIIVKNKAYRHTNADKIKEYHKAYREANKEQKIAYDLANSEAIAEYQKAYQQANKEKIAEYKKAYYQANREATAERMKGYHKAYRQKNAEGIAEKQKAYYQTPMGKASQKNKNHRRRSITKQGDVTTQQLLELTTKAKVCYWCNKSLKGKKVHIDHYVPLSKGGEHTISNLVITCSKCNLTKYAKDPIEFAQSVGKLL